MRVGSCDQVRRFERYSDARVLVCQYVRRATAERSLGFCWEIRQPCWWVSAGALGVGVTCDAEPAAAEELACSPDDVHARRVDLHGAFWDQGFC
jgi:hypothetical protein